MQSQKDAFIKWIWGDYPFVFAPLVLKDSEYFIYIFKYKKDMENFFKKEKKGAYRHLLPRIDFCIWRKKHNVQIKLKAYNSKKHLFFKKYKIDHIDLNDKYLIYKKEEIKK